MEGRKPWRPSGALPVAEKPALVAGFFFISGYGLMVSLQKKGPAYLHGFLRRRLPGVAVPYLGAAVLFALVRTLALHQNLFARTLTDALATSDTLVPFSWFIFAILYFYLLFDAAAHLGKSVPVLLAAAALGLVLYTVVLWRLGAGRARKEDAVSAGAGIRLHVKPGDTVEAGAPLLTLLTDEPGRFATAHDALTGAVVVSPAGSTMERLPLVIDRIT